jgi:ACS family sodium-dependent inorganic phosphate cotransporter-like MFS transporter 5
VFCFTGAVVGIVGTFATSGVLCEYGIDNGWGSIFYITGTKSYLLVIYLLNNIMACNLITT